MKGKKMEEAKKKETKKRRWWRKRKETGDDRQWEEKLRREKKKKKREKRRDQIHQMLAWKRHMLFLSRDVRCKETEWKERKKERQQHTLKGRGKEMKEKMKKKKEQQGDEENASKGISQRDMQVCVLYASSSSSLHPLLLQKHERQNESLATLFLLPSTLFSFFIKSLILEHIFEAPLNLPLEEKMWDVSLSFSASCFFVYMFCPSFHFHASNKALCSLTFNTFFSRVSCKRRTLWRQMTSDKRRRRWSTRTSRGILEGKNTGNITLTKFRQRYITYIQSILTIQPTKRRGEERGKNTRRDKMVFSNTKENENKYIVMMMQYETQRMTRDKSSLLL